MCNKLEKINFTKINLIKQQIDNSNNDNPKLIIESFILPDHRIFNVCQDGYLIAGTKQRVVVKFIKKIIKNSKQIKYLLYAGMYNGFGAIATAFAAYRLGLKSIVFLSKIPNVSIETINNSKQICTLHALNATIYLCDDFRSTRKAEYKLASIPDKNNKNKWIDKPEYYVVPMGLKDDNNYMIKHLSKNIKRAAKHTIFNKIKEKRIWLVAGSSGILQSLYSVYPDASYFVYFTGGGSYKDKSLAWAKEHKINILNDFKLVKKFDLQRENYYSSIKNYDDLIWNYLLEYGLSGDFIWNVASE